MQISECKNPDELTAVLREMSKDPQHGADLASIDYWILHQDSVERIYLGGLKRRFIVNLKKYVTTNLKYVSDNSQAYQWMARQLETTKL